MDTEKAKHSVEVENQMKALAQILLYQWPCSTPVVLPEDYTSVTFSLLDVGAAYSVIVPEWERLFQNMQLSSYIDKVQEILSKMNAFSNPMPTVPNARELEPITLQHTRYVDMVSLEKQLCTAPSSAP